MPSVQSMTREMQECLATHLSLDKCLKVGKGKSSALVLILDEIDSLLCETGAIGSRQRFLETLINRASDPQYAFALIGISNSVDNTAARRLAAIGKVRNNSYVTNLLLGLLFPHVPTDKLCFSRDCIYR